MTQFIVTPHSLQWELPNGQRVDIHGLMVGKTAGMNDTYLANHKIKVFNKTKHILIILN